MIAAPALSCEGAGKRYGSNWALRGCSLQIPAGSVTALVGPNGAGKTTLLQMAVGTIAPSEGTIETLGWSPRRDPMMVLPRIGFVAQDHPLYRGFTLAELLKFGRKLNNRWDDDLARQRLEHLGLRLQQRVGKLSGGQQAQVALTLALAKRPELLLLDEPAASLDPLARREFLSALMEAVAEQGVTVVLSSHILAELERVCDHLVILSRARVLLTGSTEEIVQSHRLLTGMRRDVDELERLHAVIDSHSTERQTSVLVRANGHVYDSHWQVSDVGLEQIVLAYLALDPGEAPAQELTAA
ncbi:MAG: ABC transporter ATP-binding protein [Conexibacteraceae bacterium]|nr:ABC transporter ATP-binding protein [Conexibacteraceae bacterium]